MEELFGADSDPEEEENGEKEAAADDMEELFGADSDDQEGEEDGRGPAGAGAGAGADVDADAPDEGAPDEGPSGGQRSSQPASLPSSQGDGQRLGRLQRGEKPEDLEIPWQPLEPHRAPAAAGGARPGPWSQLSHFRPTTVLGIKDEPYDRSAHKFECLTDAELDARRAQERKRAGGGGESDSEEDEEERRRRDDEAAEKFVLNPNVNTIRWRYKRGGGADEIESNARLIIWDDGSASVVVGDEMLKCDYQTQGKGALAAKQRDAAAAASANKSEIGIRTLFVRDEASRQKMLYAQGAVVSKLVVRPFSLKSKSHQKIKERQQLVQRLEGEAGGARARDGGRGIKTTVTLRDPEMDKREKEIAEEKRIRDREKLKNRDMRRKQKSYEDQFRSRRLDVNYLEEDDELGDVAVTANTARAALGLHRDAGAADQGDSEGTDDADGGDDRGKGAEDAALARPGAPSSGVKVSGKGKRTLEESESEGEGGEDEQEPGATQDAPSSSKRQRRAIIDEDDEDDD